MAKLRNRYKPKLTARERQIEQELAKRDRQIKRHLEAEHQARMRRIQGRAPGFTIPETGDVAKAAKAAANGGYTAAEIAQQLVDGVNSMGTSAEKANEGLQSLGMAMCKNRHGEAHETTMHYDPSTATFKDAPPVKNTTEVFADPFLPNDEVFIGVDHGREDPNWTFNGAPVRLEDGKLLMDFKSGAPDESYRPHDMQQRFYEEFLGVRDVTMRTGRGSIGRITGITS